MDVVLHEEPCALVLRLVLAPHDLGGVGVLLELRRESLVREGVELLDADHGHVARLLLLALLDQVVIDLARADHHAAHALGDVGAEVFLDRRRRIGTRCEHQAVVGRHAQLHGSLRLRLGIGRHAALAVDALAEGDARELALQVVGPVVVDAGDVLGVPLVFQHQQRAAMRAAVLPDAQGALEVARHHHRHVADERRTCR